MNTTAVDKKFVVWIVCETAHEWIEYVKRGSADTIEEAVELACSYGGCWGIRRSESPKPSFIGEDDGLWITVGPLLS